MTTSPPRVINDQVEGTHIYVGTNVWFHHWLTQPGLQSFRYECPEGSFTARQRKGGYWNAYRKMDGKLRQEYLGKAEDLSCSRLIGTARILALPGGEYWRKKYPTPGASSEKLYNEVIQASDRTLADDQIKKLQDQINQLEQELSETKKQRDEWEAIAEAHNEDKNDLKRQIEELQAEVLTESKAARILQALGVGRQALQYKRVQAVLRNLMH